MQTDPQRLVVGHATFLNVGKTLDYRSSSPGRGKNVDRLFQCRQVIGGDQHRHRAPTTRDRHTIMRLFDARDILRQPILGFAH